MGCSEDPRYIAPTRAEIARTEGDKRFAGKRQQNPVICAEMIKYFWNKNGTDWLPRRVCQRTEALLKILETRIDSAMIRAVNKAAKKHQIPPAFFLVIGAMESNLNRTQGSNGLPGNPAWGIMQFSSDTLKGIVYNGRKGVNPMDIWDPSGADDAKLELAMDIAGQIIKEKIAKFGSDPVYTLAGYNGGLNRIWGYKWPTLDQLGGVSYPYIRPGETMHFVLDVTGLPGHPWDQNAIYVETGKYLYQVLMLRAFAKE